MKSPKKFQKKLVKIVCDDNALKNFKYIKKML